MVEEQREENNLGNLTGGLSRLDQTILKACFKLVKDTGRYVSTSVLQISYHRSGKLWIIRPFSDLKTNAGLYV